MRQHYLTAGSPETAKRHRDCGIMYDMNISRYFPADLFFPICAVRTRMKRFLMYLPIAALLCFPGPAACSTAYRFDNQNELLGAVNRYTVKNNESLYEIARTYKIGFNEIVAANPGIDPYVPGKGTSLILPTSWLLPDISRVPGIVVNVSEMRLFYFFKKKGTVRVKTYPIGIGDEGSDTPLGRFTIVEKIVNPAWHVPESIRKEKPELPAVVPPGPDNPMGSHALRLSRRTILIHGTDVPWGIGGKVSHGCIRLYPEDIVELFRIVPLKTAVTIVQQPVKVGVSRGQVYLEVNKDEDQDLKSFDYRSKAVAQLRKRGLLDRVSMDKVAQAVRDKKGFPVDVSLKKNAGHGSVRAPR
jgi:L,D-transpeptidase ErfK/SrfK